MLLEALDAQLARGDLEGAAVAAYLLGMWSFDVAGDGERADAAWARAADYAGRIPYTPVASLIAYEQAFRLLSTGRYAEALRFTERAIARAEAAGDEQGRALVLMWHGFIRVTTGDAAGIAESEEAAGVLASHAHAKTTNAFHNLGEALVALGQKRRAREVRAQAVRWAERFADVFLMDLVETSIASDAYHAGEWTRALELSVVLLGRPALLARAEARWTHGRILLARAPTEEVREEAEFVIEAAEAAASDEMLFMGAALGILAADALGDAALDARASERFFGRWEEIGATLISAHALAEIAAIRPGDDRVHRAVALLPPAVPWRAALDGVVEGRYADAAARYREIGSRPLEASANGLAARQAAEAGDAAEARRLAGLALGFYREVGATRLAAELEPLAGTATSTRPASTRTE